MAENLRAAEDAVAYVKSLNIRAMNLLTGRLAAAGGIDQVIGTDQDMGSVLGEMRRGFATFNETAPDAQDQFDAIREGAFAKAGPAGVGVFTLRRTQRGPDSLFAVRANAVEIIASRFGNC